MAWRRGFLRIWIVLSIVWIFAAGAFLWSPILGGKVIFEDYYRFSWDEPRAIRVTPLDPVFEEMVTGRPAVGMTIETLMSSDFAFHLYYASGALHADLARSIAVVQAELDKMQAEQDRHRAASMPGYIAALVLPPLLILGLGAVTGWIASGFRKPA